MDAKKIIIYLLALSFALVAQTSIFPAFFSNFSIPQITLMLILVWVTRKNFISQLPWIIIAGFLLDLISYTPLGTTISFFVLAAYAFSFFSRRLLVEKEKWGIVAIFFFIVIITMFHRFFLLITFFLTGDFFSSAWGPAVFFRHLSSEVTLNCLLFFLLFYLFKRKNEKVFSLKEIQ